MNLSTLQLVVVYLSLVVGMALTFTRPRASFGSRSITNFCSHGAYKQQHHQPLSHLFLHNHADMLEHGHVYFQLEELEDSQACATEIYLRSDHMVVVGDTNGPKFASAEGRWRMLNGKNNANGNDESLLLLEMTISKTFETGREKLSFTDVGKFSFTVKRRFVGTVSSVGDDTTIVEGTIHNVNNDDDNNDDDDKFSSTPIGYFSMIETTQDRQKLGLTSIDKTLNTTRRRPIPPPGGMLSSFMR